MTRAEPWADPQRTAPDTVVVLLAAAAALGQFSTSIYVPSIPAMVDDLPASERALQLSIAAYLVPLAFLQLVLGPVSDRYGRRPTLCAGFAIFLVGTGLCIAAQDIGLLIVGRVLQGVGACAGLVVSRAVARDLFDGSRLVKAMSIIAIVFAVVPGVAPLLGGVIQDLLGWRATFVTTALVGAATAWLVLLKIPETLRAGLDRLSVRAGAAAYRPMLQSGRFGLLALVSACPLVGLFAFLAGGPLFLIDEIGLTPTQFGVYPPMAITGFVAGAMLANRLAATAPIDRLLVAGAAANAAGAGIALVLRGFGLLDEITLVLCMWLFLSGMGMVLPLASAGAIRPFSDRAGSASALLGFAQMGGAVAGTLAVAMLAGALGSLAFPLVMAAASAMGLAGLAAAPAEAAGRGPS